MTPTRSTTINDFRIAEYVWGGDLVVYVDYRLVESTYEDACARAEKREPQRYVKR